MACGSMRPGRTVKWHGTLHTVTTAYWAAFDASGRLVTTSWDGHVRLYDTAFQLHRKAPTPGGKQPYAAAFSPDGRYIAVGYDDSTQVDVLASKDLTRAYAANTTGVNNGDLCDSRLVTGRALPLCRRAL